MANPILNLGNNEWATKSESLLGYSKSGSNFKPVPFTHNRASIGTTIDRNGVLQTEAGNIPRIDFKDNIKGALLLEPQRTNKLIYSEDFANAVWSKQGTSSVTSNTTTAPDGSLTANTLSGATGTGVSGDVLRRNVTVSVRVTLSIYVKSLGGTNFTIYIRNGANGQVQSQSITPNNTWQKVSLTHDLNNGQIFFGNTNGDVAIWGAQLEEGSYPTSYIQTGASTVTRLKDECTNGGNADLFNDSEGTLFVDLENFDTTATELTLSSGSSSNRITFLFYGSAFSNPNKLRFYLASAGSAQVDSLYNISYTFNQQNKIAFKYKQNDFKIYINGTQVFSDTSGNTPIGLSRFDFASFNATSGFIEGKINQTLVFNEALSDSELQTLTTL